MSENYIFVHETKWSVWVWVMTPSEFIEGSLENAQHIDRYNDIEWRQNDDCNCYQCKRYIYDSKLQWALEIDNAKMFETFDDAFKFYLPNTVSNKTITKALDRAYELGGNYRLKKGTA